MILSDTHSHIYLEDFNNDIDLVIENAKKYFVEYIFLPNIDSKSIDKLINLYYKYPNICFPMIGIHPTSVKENYKDEINIIEQNITKHPFCAIGEIGIDLYWDKTYIKEQDEAFRYQLILAKKNNLPVSIHSRNSLDIIIKIIKETEFKGISGVFHCFPGNLDQAKKIIDLGYKIGVGGVLTYKNSGLAKVVSNIDLENILLETDAPFLPPVPFRGQRNESAYIYYIAKNIADIKNVSIETVAEITTNNAKKLFLNNKI